MSDLLEFVTQDRVIVAAQSGEVVEDLEHPRESMLALAPLGKETIPVGPQHRRDSSIGYALWAYLLEPYITFQWPGVTMAELDAIGTKPVSPWRRLRVTFPESLFTHERTHIHYLDSRTGLQRRMDRTPRSPKTHGAAHYTFEHRYFGDVPVPSARRVLLRDAKGHADQYFSPIQVDAHFFPINP